MTVKCVKNTTITGNTVNVLARTKNYPFFNCRFKNL